jgi:glutamate formiminotransferase
MVHNIIYFFKDNLTIPKTKDLVSLTEKKYEEIYNIMKKNKSSPQEYEDDDIDNRSVDSSTTFIDALPTSLDMKEELKNFLKLHQ